MCLTEPVTSHRHVVLAFVTSRQPEEPLDTEIVLDPQDPDFAQTGLQVRSTIRTHRLLTVASSIIKRELGIDLRCGPRTLLPLFVNSSRARGAGVS